MRHVIFHRKDLVWMDFHSGCLAFPGHEVMKDVRNEIKIDQSLGRGFCRDIPLI